MPSQRSNHAETPANHSGATRTDGHAQRVTDPTASSPDMLLEQPASAALLQRARNTTDRLTPQEVIQLQRTISNSAVRRLIEQRAPAPNDAVIQRTIPSFAEFQAATGQTKKRKTGFFSSEMVNDKKKEDIYTGKTGGDALRDERTKTRREARAGT